MTECPPATERRTQATRTSYPERPTSRGGSLPATRTRRESKVRVGASPRRRRGVRRCANLNLPVAPHAPRHCSGSRCGPGGDAGRLMWPPPLASSESTRLPVSAAARPGHWHGLRPAHVKPQNGPSSLISARYLQWTWALAARSSESFIGLDRNLKFRVNFRLG
jgi:hypothetical protein